MQPSSNYVHRAVDFLKELIAIPAPSREEKQRADFIQTYLEENGFQCFRSGNNVWTFASEWDAQFPTLLLNSHMDTVKPVKGWTIDPFQPIEKEGKIYGLGSNDAGASLVSLLHVFMLLSLQKQPYNLIFAATAEEEISGNNGIESILKEFPAVDFAIVGEPTDLNFAIAEKGLMVLDCIAHGKAGHAARNEGENAIYKAIQDIEWIKNHHFEKISDLLGEVKMTVTQIQAGTQHNVVPDQCTFVVDVRSNELYRNEELLNEIKHHLVSEVNARSLRLSSSATPSNHPVLIRANELGRILFGSPTLSDQALMPFPSVKVGPGKSERSHTADEFIEIEEIRQGIELYYQLLNGLNISLL